MILVTGGLGYIGSHTVVKLIESGYDVLIIDNLINSKVGVLDKIENITNVRPKFINCDIRVLPHKLKIYLKMVGTLSFIVQLK